jgi:hypothetical protein
MKERSQSNGETTAPKALELYLNDHLAASVTAIKLLSRLQTPALLRGSVSPFAAEIQADVESDQGELKTLMDRLQVKESPMRKATGWIAEKFTELKLKLDDPSNSNLAVLEILEIVEIGIEGKRGLWQALAASSANFPALRDFDFQRLTQRAQQQHDRVEAVRLQAARQTLPASSTRNPWPVIGCIAIGCFTIGFLLGRAKVPTPFSKKIRD